MARANVSYHVFVWWMRREPRSAWSLPGSRSLTYGSYGISEPAQEPEPEDNSPEFSVRGWTTQDILSLKPPLSSRRSLTRIDLNSNNIWDRGAQAVADAIRACPQLAIVELENNTIGATGVVALADAMAQSPHNSLTSLNLRGNRAGNVGVDAIAKALRSMSHKGRGLSCGLTSLDVSANFARAEAALAITEVLPLYGKLRQLNLSQNFLQGEGAASIAKVLTANPGLTQLQLNSCYIRGEGGVAIAKALRWNTQLLELGLSDNYLDGKALSELASALEHNSTLQKLDIAGVYKPSSAGPPRDALDTSSRLGPSASFRSSLSLSRSRIMPTVGRADDSTAEHGSAIGTLGATLLARGLANNRGLLSLCVASNDIGDDGLSALCDALKTGVCPLRILDVSDNPCGPKASAALLAAAKGSDSLMDVTMTGWELPPEHARQLGAVLQEHSERFQVGESYRKRAELEAEAEAKLSELQMSQSSAIDRVVSSHTSAATDTARISVIKKEMLKKQEEESMLMSARSDLETQASALQANRDRMDAQWAQAENDRRKAEQEVLIAQGDLELIRARVDALKRQVSQDSASVLELETSLSRAAARIAEANAKKELAYRKLEGHSKAMTDLKVEEATVREQLEAGEQRLLELKRLLDVERLKEREEEAEVAVAEARAAESTKQQAGSRARVDEAVRQRSELEAEAARVTTELTEAKRRTGAAKARVQALQDAHKQSTERYRRLEQQLADERQAADELSATLEQSRVKCASVLQEAEDLRAEEETWRRTSQSSQASLTSLDRTVQPVVISNAALKSDVETLTRLVESLSEEIGRLRKAREAAPQPRTSVMPQQRNASVQTDADVRVSAPPALSASVMPVDAEPELPPVHLKAIRHVEAPVVVVEPPAVQRAAPPQQPVTLQPATLQTASPPVSRPPFLVEPLVDQHEDEAEEQPVDTSGDGPAVPEHPRAEFFAELLREGAIMRCKPASDKRFCYYRASANEALTHLLFTPADNTEIGAHLFPALSADAIVEIVEGPPMVMPPGKSIFKCGAKVSSSDAPKVLETTCFTLAARVGRDPIHDILTVDIQAEHEDVRLDWVAALQWMRAAAVRKIINETEKQPPPAMGNQRKETAVQQFSNNQQWQGPQTLPAARKPEVAPVVKNAVFASTGDEFEEEYEEQEHYEKRDEPFRPLDSDDFDQEPPLSLHIVTQGGVGAPTPLPSSQVPSQQWEQQKSVPAQAQAPQAQPFVPQQQPKPPQAQSVVPPQSRSAVSKPAQALPSGPVPLPVPSVPISAPATGNREDEDGPPNLQDLGPDGTPLAEVSALRSKLWELVSGIPPEQEVLPTYKELREEVTGLLGLNLTHKGWRKWFRQEIDAMFAKLDEEGGIA